MRNKAVLTALLKGNEILALISSDKPFAGVEARAGSNIKDEIGAISQKALSLAKVEIRVHFVRIEAEELYAHGNTIC